MYFLSFAYQGGERRALQSTFYLTDEILHIFCYFKFKFLTIDQNFQVERLHV